MIRAGVIQDYTYLWHDVRPHPKFGTVEIRVMDSQTHIEHAVGLTALVQAMVKELAEHFDAGKQLSEYPWEMLDENKWLAARHGLEGEIVDLPSSDRVATRALARRILDRMREHCQDLGSEAELEADRGPAGARQRRRSSGRRLRGQPRSARGRGRDRRRDEGLTPTSDARSDAALRAVDRRRRNRRLRAVRRFYNRFVSTGGQDLFVVCKNCGSEVSPYITECPYCGNRLRKRAPKLDRDQRPAEPKPRRTPAPLLGRLRRNEIPGIAPDRRPYATIVLVLLGMVGCVMWRTGLGGMTSNLIIVGKPGTQWWRLFTAAFTYDNTGYAFVTLFAIGAVRVAAGTPARAAGGGRAVPARRDRRARPRPPACTRCRSCSAPRRGAGDDLRLGGA